MKKTLSILCVVALLLCSVMIPVSAAELKVTATTTATPAIGEEFTVDIVLSGNIESTGSNDDVVLLEGIAYGNLDVTFSDGLTLTKATLGSTLKSIAVAGKNMISPYRVTYSGTDGVAGNGTLVTLTFTAAAAGTYTISPAFGQAGNGNLDDLTFASEPTNVTVKGSDPTPVAKTVTYTAANGTVMASTVALAAPAEAKASGTIKTAGTAAEEEVYFYFFPNKGYTTDGMTVNGEAVIGAAGSKKYTVTADATYDFVFKKIEDAAAIAAKPTGAISGTPAAASLTTFATAAGASEFGILIGAADAWGADITADYAAASETGKIRKYAALEANGEGQFAIELNDTAKNFLKNGTYKAYIYAANGSNVTFGDAIDIAIAE